MKFQTLTYQRLRRSINVCDPFVSEAVGPGVIDGLRSFGQTPEESRSNLIKLVKEHMSNTYTNLVVTDEEV